jgi:hypothetical protein
MAFERIQNITIGNFIITLYQVIYQAEQLQKINTKDTKDSQRTQR